MSMINREIADFTVQAFHEGAFRTVSREDVLGRWSVFLLLPGGLHLCVPDGTGGSGGKV